MKDDILKHVLTEYPYGASAYAVLYDLCKMFGADVVKQSLKEIEKDPNIKSASDKVLSLADIE